MKFWSRVKKQSDGCWIWTGAVSGNGYGAISISGRVLKASRVAYELAVGPIPPGLCVLHRCDVPLCMNPAHLYAGTHQQNMRDVAERKRVPFGERHHHAKLTREHIAIIRASTERAVLLAQRFGVGRHAIQSVRAGKSWRHV